MSIPPHNTMLKIDFWRIVFSGARRKSCCRAAGNRVFGLPFGIVAPAATSSGVQGAMIGQEARKGSKCHQILLRRKFRVIAFFA